jgi:uncharacterized protein
MRSQSKSSWHAAHSLLLRKNESAAIGIFYVHCASAVSNRYNFLLARREVCRTLLAGSQRPGARRKMSESVTLESTISKQIVAAMKAHDADRATTLRMVKAALMNKTIEKRAAEKKLEVTLTQQESEQVLTTMIKQRRDSIEQFTKGKRPELAAKEAAEIVIIEEFLPKALDEAGLAALVSDALTELETTLGHKPTQKDMGPSMKAVQAKLQATGLRADGRLVSEMVKKGLAG